MSGADHELLLSIHGFLHGASTIWGKALNIRVNIKLNNFTADGFGNETPRYECGNAGRRVLVNCV